MCPVGLFSAVGAVWARAPQSDPDSEAVLVSLPRKEAQQGQAEPATERVTDS